MLGGIFILDNILKIIKKHNKIFILVLILILVCRVVYSIYLYEAKYKNSNENEKFEVKIISLKSYSKDKVSYIVKYDKNKFLLNIFKNDEDKNIEKSEKDVLKYGDILVVRGKIAIPELLGNPYEINYKKNLNSNGICGIINTYKILNVEKNKKKDILSLIFSYRARYEEKVVENLPVNEGELLKSILYSSKIMLDENIKNNISNIGISHILVASSGSFIMVLKLVEKLRKFYSKYFIKLLQIFFCIVLFIFSESQLSTFRALIIVIISILSQDKISKINKIFISIYILLLYNPYNIFNISVFSYLAILGVTFLYDEIRAFNNFKTERLLFRLGINNKYMKKIFIFISQSFSLTLSILLFSLPVQICLFNSFNIMIFLSNIVVVPLVFIVRFLGYISIFFVYIFNISDILINSLYIPLKVLISICEVLSSKNIQISIASFSVFSIILYYLTLTLFIIKIRYIKILTIFNKKKRKKFKNTFIVILIFCILFIVGEQVYINILEEYVYFFNVKQGNMALIKKGRQVIVIDCGSTTKGLAKNILNNFLRAKNIKSIDLILITHMHEDHINGILEINNENIKIKNVAYGKIWHNINEEYVKISDYLKNKNIGSMVLCGGDNFNLDKILIKCLSPCSDKKIESSDEINSNSAVYKIEIKSNIKSKKTLLFMGDATVESERIILQKYRGELLDVDVLQVGHHGSKTSSSDEFIKVVLPKISVISSYKKVYNHPSEEVVNTLTKYNLNFHITENKKSLKIDL
mgnify:CR=1 FL=1